MRNSEKVLTALKKHRDHLRPRVENAFATPSFSKLQGKLYSVEERIDELEARRDGRPWRPQLAGVVGAPPQLIR